MHGNVVTIVSIGDCMPTCNAGSEIKGHVHLQRMGRSMHGATRQTGVSALSLTQAAVRWACACSPSRVVSLMSGCPPCTTGGDRKIYAAVLYSCGCSSPAAPVCCRPRARAADNVCNPAQATEDEILGACIWAPQKVKALSGVKIQRVLSASYQRNFRLLLICVAKAGLPWLHPQAPCLCPLR